MNIHDVDLNLLVLFDAMATHHSVNRAAQAIGLSQPATSAALSRLRTLFDDPLFVRTGTRMEPTPRAQALAPVVRRVVEAITTELLVPNAFDPATADRSFSIVTPDIGEVSFLPGVLQRLRQEAPLVQLKAIAKPREAAAGALESGEADLAVGFFPDLHKAGFFQQGLFKSTYVCIACARNDAAPARMTQKQFLEARHIRVLPNGREHLIDGFLADKGWSRHVTLELSHFMSLLALLPGTDLIATVPEDIATVVSRHVAVKMIELPFKPPQLHVQQFWHRRMQQDPANRWLRGIFHSVNRREPGAALAT